MANERFGAALASRRSMQNVTDFASVEHGGSRRARSIAALLLSGGVSLAAAALGASVGNKRRNKLWYRALRKSQLTPPDATFGLVWPALYSLSSWSAWRVSERAPSADKNRALAAWALQSACNAAWTPLFFGAHRPRAALADLLGNAVALGAYTLYARRVDKPAALMMVPYLAWLGFAGVLNGAVIAKNRGPRRWLLRG
jgi:tryptophan-rich sensory protein